MALHVFGRRTQAAGWHRSAQEGLGTERACGCRPASCTSPRCSSMVITGSTLLIASIWPVRNACSAPAAHAHTRQAHVGRHQSGAKQQGAAQHAWLAESGAETPIRRPRRSATAAVAGHRARDTPTAIWGARPCSTKRLEGRTTALQTDGVLVSCNSPRRPRQCASACNARRVVRAVDQADIQPLGPEIAQLRGHGQRQVGERCVRRRLQSPRALPPDASGPRRAAHRGTGCQQRGSRGQRTSSNRIGMRHDGPSPVIVVVMTSVPKAGRTRIGNIPSGFSLKPDARSRRAAGAVQR